MLAFARSLVTGAAMVFNLFGQFPKALRSLWPRSAVRLNKQGARLRKRGKLDEAVAVLNNAIGLDPQLAEAYANRCACYCDREEYAKAIEDADRAIALDPKMASVYRARSWSWYQLDELDSALADMDEALRLEPQSAGFQCYRANILYELDRIDEASTQYESALVQDPELKGGWLGGAILLKQGKWRDAIQQFDVVLEADPTSPRAYYDRGDAWYRLREYENALRDLDEAVRLKPEVAVYQFFRAQVLLAVGRIDEASAQYESALVQNPNLRGSWLGGAIALKRGKFREAVERFDAVREAAPTGPRVYCNRAEAWYRLGEYKNALRDLDEAIRLEPETAAYLHFRAQVLLELGRIDEASVEYEAALARRPELKGGWLGGAILLKQGKFREAIEQFDALLETNPTAARVYHDRGEAWYRLGEYENALRDLDETVKLAPDYAVFHRYRALVFVEMRRYADADQELAEAMQRDPDHIHSHMYLAWLRATCPEADLRDGRQAVAMAHKAVELAGGVPNSGHCAVLAAAYAETGDFAEAIRWGTEALATATDEGRPRCQAYLEQYQAGMPHRMPDSES